MTQRVGNTLMESTLQTLRLARLRPRGIEMFAGLDDIGRNSTLSIFVYGRECRLQLWLDGDRYRFSVSLQGHVLGDGAVDIFLVDSIRNVVFRGTGMLEWQRSVYDAVDSEMEIRHCAICRMGEDRGDGLLMQLRGPQGSVVFGISADQWRLQWYARGVHGHYIYGDCALNDDAVASQAMRTIREAFEAGRTVV